MIVQTPAEREALDLLPYPLSMSAVKYALQNGVRIHEIRLRVGQYLAITSRGENIKCGVRCTREHIDEVLRRLCGNSLYSHADTIRDGYVSYRCGIRAGVCGRAVTCAEEINAVTDITSINIRIPHRARGAADEAYELLKGNSFSCGMLVYSVPGVGKTTLLRELIVRLAGGESPRRVAVVDSRCELMAGVEEGVMADVLLSYPRNRGIEIAMRTLSPQFIVCDEISSAEDASAVMAAAGSGVNIIASAHAGAFEELMKRECFRDLNDKGIFGIYVGLLGRESGFAGYKTEISFCTSPDEVTRREVQQ